MSKNIAIITARGGSKRIPRKNIKSFLGKPIIQYSIDAALNSNCFDEVMVSTDDHEIAEISIGLGAKIPFMRSELTANDFATTSEVIYEVLSEYHKLGKEFKYACCIYPTAPFLTPKLIEESLLKIINTKASSLIPVAAFESTIWRALEIKDNLLCRIWPENESKRSQDLPTSYYDVGQYYWLDVKEFLKSPCLVTNNTTAIILNSNQIHDIDTIEDWEKAESKYKMLNLAG